MSAAEPPQGLTVAQIRMRQLADAAEKTDEPSTDERPAES